MPLIAIGPTNRCPVSNPREVFEGECLAGHEGFLDQGLANAMVHVLPEAMLPRCVLVQAALRVLRTHLLEPTTADVIASADLPDSCAAKGLALTVGRQIDNPEINTHDALV